MIKVGNSYISHKLPFVIPLYSPLFLPVTLGHHWSVFYHVSFFFFESIIWMQSYGRKILRLASFTLRNAFEIHPSCVCQQFGPLYFWVIFHCMDIPLFIFYSLTKRCLNCFYFLVFMSRIAINTFVLVFVQM